jgi:FkbM family methyltransferase
MALAAWKRLEKSAGYQRSRRYLRGLVGKELRLRPEIEVPVVTAGGWSFTPEGLDESSVVYSLGVGDSIGFDLRLIADYGAEVHAFDPTPDSIEMLAHRDLPERFHFHPWAVTSADGPVAFRYRRRRDGGPSKMMSVVPAGEAGSAGEAHKTAGGAPPGAIEVPGYTLPTIAARLGHSRIDLLKMDIEGAEYGVIEGLLASPIRPRQILVEFHHRFPGIGLPATAGAVAALREAGYRIFAVSDVGREVSFQWFERSRPTSSQSLRR